MNATLKRLTAIWKWWISTNPEQMTLRLGALLALMLFSGLSWSQATEEFRWVQLSERVGVLQAGERITNVGVVSGVRDGLVIDTYLANQAEGLVQQIVSHLDTDPNFVVTTHSHGDHWGANSLLAERGALIVAQRQTFDTMSGDSWSIIREQMMLPAPADALADLLVDRQLDLNLGTEIQLIHLPSAHTGGDLLVWMPEENLMFAGDVLAMGYPTLIDAVNQGSIDGLIQAQLAMLALTDENTRIIPGHGPITDQRALEMSVRFMVSLRTRLSTLEELPEDPLAILDALPDLGQRSDPFRANILLNQAFQSLQTP